MKLDSVAVNGVEYTLDKLGISYEVIDPQTIITEGFLREVRKQLGEEPFDYLEQDLPNVSVYKMVNGRTLIESETLGEDVIIIDN